jgi:tRNA modification GTPase
LFNALVESEAAITSPIAGTTRDVIERTVAIGGVPFCFVDTAGLRGEVELAADAVEAEGITRARAQLERADLVLWLGEEGGGPQGCWEIAAQCDAPTFAAKSSARHCVSAVSGEGLPELKRDLVDFACVKLPKPGEAALSERQHLLLGEAAGALRAGTALPDLLLAAEELRRARLAFDTLIGRSATEDMLDALFGRFCIGK